MTLPPSSPEFPLLVPRSGGDSASGGGADPGGRFTPAVQLLTANQPRAAVSWGICSSLDRAGASGATPITVRQRRYFGRLTDDFPSPRTVWRPPWGGGGLREAGGLAAGEPRFWPIRRAFFGACPHRKDGFGGARFPAAGRSRIEPRELSAGSAGRGFTGRLQPETGAGMAAVAFAGTDRSGRGPAGGRARHLDEPVRPGGSRGQPAISGGEPGSAGQSWNAPTSSIAPSPFMSRILPPMRPPTAADRPA